MECFDLVSYEGEVSGREREGEEELLIEWKPQKRQKCKGILTNFVNGVDLISSLEDTLLCHILSFLPTKYAVRTSVLSKRWKLIWTKTPVLDFSEWWDTESHDNSNFPRFVTNVLLLNNVSCLKRLCFDRLLDFDPSHVHAWMANLVMRDIQELNLDNGFYHRVFDVPIMFFTCVRPMILKLSGGSIRELPILVKYSNLKVLQLADLESVNNNLNNLVQGCPVLEELDVYNCNWNHIDINSSTIKRLAIRYPGKSVAELSLRAPNLEELALSCIKVNGGQVDIMKRLTKGKISLDSAPLRVLRIVCGAKTVCLNVNCFQDTAMKAICLNRLKFSKMTYLELEVTEDVLPLLPYILNCSPNLISLVLIKGMASFTGLPLYARPEGDWMIPSFVPECLSSCLETITISFFEECEDYLEMVGYLLKTAKLLKEMKLRICKMDPEKEINILRNLIMLPRASITCQVKIC